MCLPFSRNKLNLLRFLFSKSNIFHDRKMLFRIRRAPFCISIILSIVVLCSLQTHQTEEIYNRQNLSLTSDTELMKISEELFTKYSHELFNYVHINYQGHTNYSFSDNAPERLLNVSSKIFLAATVKSLIKLFDNYKLDTNQPEIITKEREIEENEFVDNIIKTDAMLRVMHFLSTKGFFEHNLEVYKKTLKDIWFGLYSRTKGIIGSSGFEHVFLGERKPRKGIIGFHNWISFFLGESPNRINYLGFSRNKEFIRKAVILEAFFTYIEKPKMSTMFIGTSPELEIALYTLCFFTRPNKRCQVSFASFKFDIQTYTIQNNSTRFVATAYPILAKI